MSKLKLLLLPVVLFSAYMLCASSAEHQTSNDSSSDPVTTKVNEDFTNENAKLPEQRQEQQVVEQKSNPALANLQSSISEQKKNNQTTVVESNLTAKDNQTEERPEQAIDLTELNRVVPIDTAEQPTRPVFGGRFYRRTLNQLSSSLNISEPTAEESVEQSDDVLQSLPFVTGQARGYMMLYAMQPNARRTVEAQIAALSVAGLDNIFLGVLIDGTFSQDFDFLRRIIREINGFTNKLTLALYLTNGSTMRRFDTTEIDVSFNTIDPFEFRRLIFTNENIRNQFQDFARIAQDIFNFNKALRPQNENRAVLMLEDNLQINSYLEMRNLAKEIFTEDVIVMRNPCPGCYNGNDSTTRGDPIELHDQRFLSRLEFNDGFSNDGTNFYFENERPGPNSISIGALENIITQGYDNGLAYFGLWRRQRQGIVGATPSSHPDNREYEVPTVAQLVEEVNLLRLGLPELVE